MAFSAEIQGGFAAKIFLKGPVVWTELCVVPASMLSFSRRAALSAAKYLLMYCQVPSNLSRGVTSVSWIAQIFQ